MTSEQLFSQIRSKRSFLCVGLDTDVNKIPRHLLSQDDPVFAFNRAIVDATAPYAGMECGGPLRNSRAVQEKGTRNECVKCIMLIRYI